jgi:hypothetical protein
LSLHCLRTLHARRPPSDLPQWKRTDELQSRLALE